MGEESEAAPPPIWRRAAECAPGSAARPARQLPVRLSIPRTESEAGLLGRHSLYVVEVSALGLASEAKRLFEDFETLHAELSRKFRVALPSLPQTYWYGNEEPETVEARRLKLEGWLQQVLLMPEAICDGEERLLKFLALPKAAAIALRFVTAPEGARSAWLQSLYETTAEPGGIVPLQQPVVEWTLLDLARACLADEGRSLAPLCKRGDVVLICELLARTFRGEPDAPLTHLGQNDMMDVQLRVTGFSVLLALFCCSPDSTAESDWSIVCKVAGKALLTLAHSDRTAWASTLAEFLASGGARELTVAFEDAAREAAGDSTRRGAQRLRLLAELLLRGFEDEAVRCFAGPALAADRKCILNSLFGSNDAYSRLVVGLLLARLIADGWGLAGAVAAAERGLGSLVAELQSPQHEEPLDPGIVALLKEDSMWTWLSRLVSAPQPIVSSFALLVMQNAQPSPDLIMGTTGLHDVLQAQLEPDVHPTVRGLAACLLLTAYCGLGHEAPFPVELAGALQAQLEQALERDRDSHSRQGSSRADRQTFGTAEAALKEPLQRAEAAAAQFKNESQACVESLAAASAAIEEAEEAHEVAGTALLEQQARLASISDCAEGASPWPDAPSGTAGRPPDECPASAWPHDASGDPEPGGPPDEPRLQALADERADASRQAAEHDAAARRWQAEFEAAEAAAEAAARRARECLAEREGAARAAAEACTRAAALEGARPGPALRGPAGALEAWAGARAAQRACGARLRGAAERSQEAQGRLEALRLRRRGLQAAARSLAGSLAALDSHLDFLEQQDHLGQDALGWPAPQHRSEAGYASSSMRLPALP